MKNGYVCFHFLKLDSSNNILLNSKRTFVMTPKNIDVVLGIELDRRYEKERDEQGDVAIYYQAAREQPNGTQQAVTKVLRIQRTESNDFNLQYCELDESKQASKQELTCHSEITLKRGQIRAIQVLLEFSLPVMLGWQTLYSKDAIGESQTTQREYIKRRPTEDKY